MDLSNDLISKFVKITNDADKQKSKEGTVYGTAVKYDGVIYVKIDGSDLLTPIDTTADVKEGERVTITIKDHNATVTGNITSPSASSVDVKKVTKNVEEIEGEITEFEAIIADVVHVGELDAEVARIDELIAGKATIEDLTATNAEITNLKVKDAEIENLVADKATIEDLTATNAEITNLKADKADITYLDANFATIDQLKVTHADIDVLDAEVANINTLVNGNLTSDNILSFNITSKNTTMEDAFIKDAMIDRITANKIMSGTIDTNNVVIQSTDGSMLLQGNILQMKDESGKVRIQIGKDTGGDFTFVLYDETGKGVLIDEEGIKSSDAIADGLIVDAKVADNANISGSKLDIASVITEVNNDNSTTIKSSKIYLNEQNQSLEVAFNSLKSQVETIQDVTIDGDLSSIVEQVQSNTTKIEANKEGINTLVAENVIRTEEISNLEGELQQVNTTLSNKYASLEQNINGFKTTVSSTYTTKTEFQNLAIGGRNLIRQSVVSSVSCASSSYDKSTATWTLTANAGSGGSWGAGLLISGDSVRIPYGKTYVLSFEIKVPRACTWNIDINNYALTGSSWNGNDNDNGNARATSSKSLAANQWIKCWSRISNTASGNTNKVDIYDFSNFGVVMLNETSNMTFQIRNIQGEIGNIPSEYTPALEDVQTDIFKAMSNGKILYPDPMFKQGVNNVGIYNNSANGTVTVTRIPKVSDCPTTSTHCIEVKTTGTASPGNGGLYQLIQSRANAIFIQKILAKVPTGCNLNTAANSMGTGYTDTWLTSNKGTGKWEEYIREIRCGSTGSFSTGGHVYVSGASPTTNSPLVWYVGMCTVYDITDSDERITDLTTRVSTAESKLTKDSLTTTIGSYYTTSTDVNNAITSKGYATTSQVQQTVDSLSAKFSSSGGYNKLYNTSFLNGTTSWNVNGCTMSVVGDTNSPTGKVIKVIGSRTGAGIYQFYTPNKTGYYTVSFYGRADANMNIYFGQEGSTTKTVTLTTSWQKFSHTFNRTSTNSNAYIFYPSSAGTFYMHSILVEEGELCGVWSPHPSEIYEGITTIDKNGIKISQSNYSGYTQMSASGFYVNNGSENVISVTKDGSYFKGKVVITSGSTVPTSVLSGTISSAQLDSGITSDISTAKSNASTAVSTANTASTNASNAVSTANTASTNASNAVKTANTASTNASTAVSTANTAKSTADSVKSTVDSGKTNWNNAYNRVNEWAYGAVTGSTTIDGGYIQTNTIVSDKIAAGAIIAAKIAAGAVTADKISAGAITADKLAANAITSKTITGSTITGGTISGATITSETLMKTYGGMYVGSEIWGGFKKDSNGNYSSAQTFTIRGSTALQIDGNPTRISSVTGEVKIGDASSYDNLRAREIYAQEIIYTNDLRTRDAAQLSLSNVSMRAANAFIEFSSGYGVIRVKDRNHLYLQTKGNTGGDTSAEIRCTRYSDSSNYVNIRAYNVCAQNAVYANGVNVSSDINRKRDIELYSTDALQEVCSTPVYAYHLDTDKDEELKRIGIIMQEAPLDAIDLTGKGVDLYQMVTMLWRAVQQQQEIINELKGE